MTRSAEVALAREDTTISALRSVAPGTDLRVGLGAIIAGHLGAMIVIGDEQGVDALSNGGFEINAPFTPQRMYELAKMDGAILLDRDVTTIRRANVHLMPRASLPTSETGMRHRTAERVSRQTDALVISVSQRADTVTLYRNGVRLILEETEIVLSKANQVVQTLERYRARLDEAVAHLTMLEIEDAVTFGDVAAVVQRAETVRRVCGEVERYVTELGSEGRLVSLQVEELTTGLDEDYLMLVRDYGPDATVRKAQAVMSRLGCLTTEQLLDAAAVAEAFGITPGADAGEHQVRPRGYRLLRHVPLQPAALVDRLVERFGTLKGLLDASEAELAEIDGIGPRRVQAIAEGLRRLRERSAH